MFPNGHTNPFLEDLLAFLIIVHLAGRWTIRWFGIPGLLGTIMRDATRYFLVVFTAHLVLAASIIFARVGSKMYFANRMLLISYLAFSSTTSRHVSHSSVPFLF